MDIRFGSAADVQAIALIRRDSWRAAYAGIVAAEFIEQVVGSYDPDREQAFLRSRPWRQTLVAEHRPSPASAPGAVPVTEIVGYASYGPERGLNGVPRTVREDPESRDNRRAELYALYVAPARWSTGAGRALMRRVLEETQREGYPRITVWVLEQNARARRFYERAGFRLSGRTHVLHELGGVTEVCYEQELAPA